MGTDGQQLIDWSEIHAADVVITPAFGTTIEIAEMLDKKGVALATYNTTCPFVEKVWKRSAEIGKEGYTVVIHGKYKHEETRATFSHSQAHAPSIMIRDQQESELLAEYICGLKDPQHFFTDFKGKFSAGFDPTKHLQCIGVVNQTTMLATETQAIADYLKGVITKHFKDPARFIDTRDTLCYATNDNQTATIAARDSGANLALVVGGYNSSNTSQIAEILSEAMPVFFICDEGELLSDLVIQHFDYPGQRLLQTANWLPQGPVKLVLTSGASCPDVVLQKVLEKVAAFKNIAIAELEANANSLT
jgi:4-hydroxy-3-methylbut-2-en-1-yl diphosphate reductase